LEHDFFLRLTSCTYCRCRGLLLQRFTHVRTRARWVSSGRGIGPSQRPLF